MRFRNVWVRELGKPGRKEFTFANSLLESYAGTYEGGNKIEVSVENDSLIARLGDVRFVLFAESPTKFFAKTTDLRIEFKTNADGKADSMISPLAKVKAHAEESAVSRIPA